MTKGNPESRDESGNHGGHEIVAKSGNVGPLLSEIQFTCAPRELREDGILGFVSVRYGLLRIDSIALRKSRSGRPVLSFPSRRDRHGEQHSVVRPIGDEARRELEGAIFRAIGIAGEEVRP